MLLLLGGLDCPTVDTCDELFGMGMESELAVKLLVCFKEPCRPFNALLKPVSYLSFVWLIVCSMAVDAEF